MEAEQRGMPDLTHVSVPHPIGGLKPDAMRAKAAPTVDGIIAGLTASPPA